MDLWIRNQKRDRLVKVNNLKWEKTYGQGARSGEVFFHISSNNLTLGTYMSEERVVEVFDNIQNYIDSQLHNTVETMYVYEMPKE